MKKHRRWIYGVSLAIGSSLSAQEVVPSLPAESTPPAKTAPRSNKLGEQVLSIQSCGLTAEDYAYNSSFYEQIRSRFTVRHDFGNGVGYENGYTYLEAFMPFLQQDGSWLAFGNARVVNFDHTELWEFNAGLGIRRFNPCTERILGAHLHYDGRTTTTDNYFNQITFGFESLGPFFDLRNNVYLPVGDREAMTAQGAFFNPQFVGHNLILNQTQNFVTALYGADVEAGVLVPGLERFNVRAYAGYYHYSGSGAPTINGIRGRAEANLNALTTVHFMVQNDTVFDTTVTGGLAFHFGPGKAQRSLPGSTPWQRMGERVVRDPDIVLTQRQDLVKQAAIDPATGKPFNFQHANSAAAAGGDGTVERPFNTLTALQAGSAPRDILYVHADSAFKKEGIVLQNNQRMLAEGLNHFIVATQGTFLLPRVTTGTTLARIIDAPKSAITLANDTEVTGFTIQNAGDHGIQGANIANVILRNNTIDNPDDGGIRLLNVTGTNYIQNNIITRADLEAIRVQLDIPGFSSYVISQNRIDQITDQGVEIELNKNAQASIVFQNNRVTNTLLNGTVFDLNDTSKMSANVSGNLFQNNLVNGLNFDQSASSVANVKVFDNTFQTNGVTHFNILVANSAIGRYQVVRNTLNGGISTGITANTANSAQLDMQLFKNATNRFVFLNEAGASIFRLDNSLGSVLTTNTFTGGNFIDGSIQNTNLGFPAP